MVLPKIPPLVPQPIIEKDVTKPELLPDKQGVYAPQGTPTLGTCNGDMSLAKHLALKTKGAPIRRPKGLYGMEILLLKSLHADSPQAPAQKYKFEKYLDYM